MKHCDCCNIDLSDSFEFCPTCANSLSDSRRCSLCGELAKGHWEFCASCGRALPFVASESPRTSGSEIIVDSSGTYENLYPRRRGEDVITGLGDPVLGDQTLAAKTPPTLTLLQSYGPTSETSSRQWRHTAALALLVLCLAATFGFGAWYLWSGGRSSEPAVERRAQNEVAAPEKPSDSSIPKSTSTIHLSGNSGSDERLAALQDIRSKSKPSERGEIIAALEDAERTYPNDFRFPYERAKLTIVGFHSHDESFAALMRAAEIAIDNGKAELMMESLMADKSGDFKKLSHGHMEWSMVEEALRNRNKASLKTLHSNSSDDH